MLNPNKLLRHFGLFWLIFMALQFLVLIVPIRNGLSEIHASLYSNVAQRFMPEIKLQADAQPDNGEILFKFYNQVQASRMAKEIQKTGKAGNVNVPEYEYGIDPGHYVYMALVFLIALFLATPLSWSKRFILMGIGILCFYLFSFVRVVIRLKFEIGQLNIGLYESDPTGFLSLHKVNNFLNSLGMILIVIILLWAILVFTRKNIQQLKSHLS